LIVEDEAFVAASLQNILEDMRYEVPAVASSGHQAIKAAEKFRPDLILMDIVLKGEMDGIEAASQIRAKFNIPAIYLTAYSDKKTLERAKKTEPYGYILKPFNKKDIGSEVEIVLYKAEMERRRLRHEKEYVESIVRTAQTIILLLDKKGKILDFNDYMEKISGYKIEEVRGKDWFDTFLPEKDHNKIRKIFQDSVKGIQTAGNVNPIIVKDGGLRYIEWYDITMKDEQGNVIGVLATGQDITERKKAEDKISKSKEQYQLLIHTIPDVIYEVTENGIFTFVSDGIKQLGYNPEELIGKPFREIIHPDDFESVSREIILPKYKGKITGDADSPKLFDERRTNGRGTQALECRIAIKGQKGALGGYCYTEVSSSGKWDSSVENKEKKFLGSVGIMRDVTERKQAEIELREVNTLLSGILNSSSQVSIISTDLADNILFWNTGAEKILGYKAEEVIGRNKIDILYLNDSDTRKKIKDIRAQRGKNIKAESYEIQEITKSGEKIWVSLNVTAVLDENGNRIGSLGIGEDITKRKEQEEQYKAVIKTSIDGFWINDLKGKIIDVNNSYCKMMGYSREELLKMSITSIEANENTEDTQRHLRNIIKKGKDRFETRHKHKDGSIIDIEISVIYQKNFEHMYVFIRDITELKKANKELKQTQNQLIQTEKMAAAGQLAFGIAHEIRNPLAIILQSAEILSSFLPKENMAAKKSSEILKNSIKRANNIITDLLSFSRAAKLELRPVNAHKLLNDAISLIRNRAKLSSVKINQNYPEETIRIKADSIMLQQAFYNLFSNAIDVMPNGGELNVRAYLEEKLNEEVGGKVTIEVEDTGEGIPEDELSKIFDNSFFTTKRAGKGTGLGLSIVHMIVERHNGTIDVESTLNKGTKFIIKLPCN